MSAMMPTKGPKDVAKKSVLLVPSLIMLIVFFFGPIVLTVYYSFTNLALTGSNAQNLQFIGLENYQFMLSDPNLVLSIKNTLIFLVGSLIGQQVLGFIIAYYMRTANKVFRSIVGPIVLAGWVMPEMVVALCASAFFHENGTLNSVIGFFSLPAVQWLYKHAMLTVILANIWRGTAYSMMVYQSALDSVPGDIEEAATVDGAGKLQTLFKVTIPCIRDTIFTNTMLNTLQTLGVFGLIYSMTGGGPSNATLTLPILIYNQGLKNFQLGYGTAISMVLLFIGVLLSVIYTRFAKID